MRKIGIIFYALGLLIATIAAAKVPESLGAYPDTSPFFILGFAVALPGLLMWRKGVKKSTEQVDHSKINPKQIVHAIQTEVISIAQNLDTTPYPAICKKLDELAEGHIWKLNAHHQQIKDQMGTAHGTEFILYCANGERNLNRAWSTAADKHRPECLASLDEALKSFAHAEKII